MKDDTTNKTNKAREQKTKVIAELGEKINKAKALVFTNYQGMTHQQIEQLKKALKTSDAELIIAKNTLLKRALEGENSKEEIDLKNPTATIFAYSDPIAAVKELYKIIKNLKLPVIKFGLLEGKLLDEKDVIKLSTIPSREVLLAQVVGGLKSPIFGLHRALNWNLQKLVMTLSAIQKNKSA